MALQPVQCSVIHERDAAMGTLARLATVAAEDEGRQASPVQKENGLLLPGQRAADGCLQVTAQRAEMLRRELFAHVDDRHRWQGPPLRPMWQLQQVLSAGERGGVGRDARRGTAQYQHRVGFASEPAGHARCVISGKTLLLERGRLLFIDHDQPQPRQRGKDGGAWRTVIPEDGIADSPHETYALDLPLTGAGEHTIALRAFDASGNMGSARIVVRKQ